MIKLRILFVALLLICYDRVEYAYYIADESDKICLKLDNERCFRADSFIAYACVRVQYIIVALILSVLIPLIINGMGWPLVAILSTNILYFIEYFFTYNEPIGVLKIGWGIPISIATLKMLSYCYFCVAITAAIIKQLIRGR